MEFFRRETYKKTTDEKETEKKDEEKKTEQEKPKIVPTSKIQLLQCMLADTAAVSFGRSLMHVFLLLCLFVSSN